MPSSDAVGNCCRWHPALAIGLVVPRKMGGPHTLCSSGPAHPLTLPSWS